MHGMARVWVKDYSTKRDRDLRAKMPKAAPKPNDGKWVRQLAMDMAEMGLTGTVNTTASPDGPPRPN